MNRYIHINTTLIIALFGFSALAVAQETKSDVSNENGEVCSYLLYPPKEGDLFNRGEVLPVKTVWFEDFSCMEDTEDNRMIIVDLVARLNGHQDAGFLSHEPEVTGQFHGDCFKSTKTPTVAVNIYYLIDTEFIQGFVHSLPKGTTCTISEERAGRGGRGGQMGGRPQ